MNASPSDPAALDPAALDRAIAWAVQLGSGTAGPAVRAACAAWRAADPAHEQAWQQVLQVEQPFRNLSSSDLSSSDLPGRNLTVAALAQRTLQTAARERCTNERERCANPARRRSLRLLALGAVGIASGALALHHAPWQQRAHYATAVGQRRRLALADGTQLALNTGTEADVVYLPWRRLIVLQRGEILIATGADSDALFGRRPFWVHTGQARLEAIGTRFAVRSLAGQTRLDVFEGAVDVYSEPSGEYGSEYGGEHGSVGGGAVRVAAGQALTIAANAPPQPLTDRSLDAQAWADGALIARQMRLDAFVAELARYQTAPLYCDAAVAGLRVSGVFQLDGADAVRRALKALAASLPVSVTEEAPGSYTVTARRSRNAGVAHRQ